MHTTFKIALFSTFVVLLATGFAHADAPSKVESYALLIGTNAGGEGQQDLHFAEEDAKRVSNVIQALGPTPAGNIQLVLRPSRAELEAQLDTLANRLGERKERGLQSQLLVYYSGHARANSLVLGDEEMPLSELRTRLLALPSTLTIILLDACQSGAFSRIKGIEAAEDFSVNSVNRLQAAGIAVMASSSATELSQESERLRSSFFTHHLLMGLRGAGDSDGDGRITLGEAYRYAYNTTLVDTTKTRVGTQHVTLETDLKGKGQVILTYPRTASSQLALSSNVEGKIVIQQKKSGSVVAELHKAKGSISLALPAGEYVVLVRQSEGIRRCQVTLRENKSVALQPSTCDAVKSDGVGTAKGGSSWMPKRWALELGIAQVRSVIDDYSIGLGDEGYDGFGPKTHSRFAGALVLPLRRHFAQVVIEISNLEGRTGSRVDSTRGARQTMNLSSLALLPKLRLNFISMRSRLGWLGTTSGRFFVEAGVGAAAARTSLKDSMATTQKETHYGPLIQFGIGINMTFKYGIGIYTKAEFVEATIVDDGQGGKHDIGGLANTTGLLVEW